MKEIKAFKSHITSLPYQRHLLTFSCLCWEASIATSTSQQQLPLHLSLCLSSTRCRPRPRAAPKPCRAACLGCHAKRQRGPAERVRLPGVVDLCMWRCRKEGWRRRVSKRCKLHGKENWKKLRTGVVVDESSKVPRCRPCHGMFGSLAKITLWAAQMRLHLT